MIKKLYLNDKNEFDVKTCKGVEQYLFDKCSILCDVRNTKTYLVINFVHNNVLMTEKVRHNTSMYMVSEDILKPIVEKLNELKTNL